MKKIIALVFSFLPFLLFAQTSIYDIQYTTDPGGDSPYMWQTVTTGGIVTAANFDGGRYFISSSNGGAWNGIFIYDNSNSPEVGDSIIITGQVIEYNGMTEISNLSGFSVINSLNTLPVPTNINTAQVTNEAYEGVLVKVNNCSVVQEYDNYGNWKVDDGSGECEIRPGIYNMEADNFQVKMSYPFSSIIGVVGYSYGLNIHPRSKQDFISGPEAFTFFTEDHFVTTENSYTLPVKIEIINNSGTVSSYTLNMTYDASIFSYDGNNKTGTLSESGTVTDNSTSGSISLSFSGSFTCDELATLINLQFTPIIEGDGNLQFSSLTINGGSSSYFSAGTFYSGLIICDTPSADTLTVVQRPLLNIPSIVMPGETLFIECFASETTTGWDAELFFNDNTVDLSISQSDYDSDLEKWTLQATIPAVDYYELYDLKVTASDGIIDTVKNAVKVIDQYKDDYYFVQITDTHMPGHLFYEDEGYETDETELDDLYEVIKDINLLNPEFVLFTGDVLNEGEFEDFECLRHHTKVIELLEKFEVPVYIVPGNHDLGGWDDSPPPQGTARQDWWRFFGWRQKVLPIVEEEYYVHDYSFDYGDVHYVGMESSDNYDSYMHDVYGDKGFIPSQLTWLNNDLASAGSKTKVLFYHFDFNGDIDLATVGADMALWGHQHFNTDDFEHPFNIGTDNVCDGTRAYRVIRVNDGDVLTPESTIYTNSSGQNLDISFSAENNGTNNYLEATITNNHSLSFDYGIIKFIMPKSSEGYNVTNGTLKQVIDNGPNNICYVEVAIPANDQVNVDIEKKISTDITSIYEIQYTNDAGPDGWSYPSTYNNLQVTTGGIVTAKNYLSGQYFISSSQGGPYNGIFIYDNTYSPSIGDSILITGTVYEYEGYTELKNLTSYSKISSGNTLPSATAISTTQVGWEQYEGLLVEVNNCDISEVVGTSGNFKINDSSGESEVSTGFYNLLDDEFLLLNDYSFKKFKGIVGVDNWNRKLNPRSLTDIIAADDGFIIETNNQSVSNNSVVSYPIFISIIKQNEGINSYILNVQYNAEVFQYDGFDKENTISESGTITDNSTEGNIELIFSGTTICEKVDTLIYLNFTPVSSGNADIQFSGTSINSYNLAYSEIGELESTYENTTQVGTITSKPFFKCYPNPFSQEIFLEYEIQQKTKVNISLFNSNGQKIKVLVDEIKNPGQYSIKWNGTNDFGVKVDNGIYFYKYLVQGKQIISGQIVFMK